MRFHPAPLAALLAACLPAAAWDYEGHRMVNLAALASLPPEFPAFVREPEAAERIAYLGGGPDRWRNTPDLPVKHGTNPDHFFDLEQIAWAGLDPDALPDLRYEFALRFAAGRAAHADRFAPPPEGENLDRTREWPGFAPWTVTEYHGKLKSAFSCLRVFEELGTPSEIANARADVIQIMGMMGHYVGDCAQPLHTTVHHNGWVGDNPRNYSRWPGLHAWIDGGFLAKAGITASNVVGRLEPAAAWPLPTTPDPRDPVFVRVMGYIQTQHALVERLYELEKAGVFKSENAATSVEGRAFIERQLLEGSRALASLWMIAWRQAGPDIYLRTRLLQRQNRKAE